MCYLTGIIYADTDGNSKVIENGWSCCYCKKYYTNKLTDTVCKGCSHQRCATFGESEPYTPSREIRKNLRTIDARSAYPVKLAKLQASSMYGKVDSSRKLLGLPTQHEQAKATVGLLLRAPIQDREFLIGIRTLERIINTAKTSNDDSITQDTWEKLSAFLDACRTINIRGCHVDEALRKSNG
jgi:hypothetical protein